MNEVIKLHFDDVEALLIQTSIVVKYQIIRQEIGLTDGKLRLKILLSDNGTVELFEYVSETNREITLLKYSFHWQNAHKTLIQRWDNAPHYPNLPNAPHHIHHQNGSVSPSATTPDIPSVIELIRTAIG